MPHPVPNTKTALKALLALRPAWATVSIRDEQPTEIEDVTRDMFWFNPTEIPEDGWTWLGAQRRRVNFQLAFTVAIIRDGDNPRTTEDAAWTLLDDMLAGIKADYSLGGTIQQIGSMSGQMATEPFDRMWRAVFTGRIDCQSKNY